jgi:hypothetical protein
MDKKHPLVPRDMCGSLEYGIRNFVFYQPECHSNVMEIVALPRLYHSQNPGLQNLRTPDISFLASRRQHKKHAFTLSFSLCIPLWMSPTLSFRPKSSRPPHAPYMMSSHTLGRPNLVDPSLNPSSCCTQMQLARLILSFVVIENLREQGIEL